MAARNYCSNKITTTHVLIAYVHSRLSEENCRVPALECMLSGVPPQTQSIVTKIREYDDWVMSQANNSSTMKDVGLTVVNRDSNSSTIGCGIHHVLDSMFCDGVLSFGRFIAVTMFVNQMCLSAIASGHSDKITDIINWVAFYFTRHGYDRWIEAQGGWECGMQQLRPIGNREATDLQAAENAGQQEANQQQQPQQQPLLNAAMIGTAFLGSVIASVLNVMQQQ